MIINLDGNKLFIDGSYYVFYRYYAIINWYKMQDESDDIDVSSILEKKQFIDKYDKMFEKTITELKRKYEIEWENVYFVKDCQRQEIFRNAIFPEYKSNRDNKSFNGNIFKHTYDKLLPSLILKYGFNTLSGDNLEADDVIAIITKKLQELHVTKITIITNDNDYIQLCNENIEIINLQNKFIKDRVNCDDPKMYLKIKIIQGDKSDNIPSIMKKCGPKTAQKLANNADELEKFFIKNPSARVQYEINKKLIDFNYIDEIAKDKFLEKIEFNKTT
jgi:5'-3' exonuclease